MKRKVAFVCNWGNTSEELLVYLARQTPGGQGVWGTLHGVASPGEADFLVVLEDLPASIRRQELDLQRTIFLPREPAAVRARKRYEAFRAPLAFTHDDIHQAAVWRVMRPFEELESAPYGGKSKALSTITSAVESTSGQRMRTQFLRDFAREYPGTVDVFGYGWTDQLGASYKGEIGDRFASIRNFEGLCKLKGLRDYRYSLALENCRQRNYFSEKILDCWLAWAMPIYWGCPNLSDYFPEASFHAIDPGRRDCPDQVRELIAQPIGERQIAAMREARRLVLHRYNIWPTVEEIIEGRRSARSAPPALVRRLFAFLRDS
ncbi:MAG TPA: glycosyltransferase family 10 [Burkholderiales bacterium]|nr:glycosyltransferase family 10 [Burkholderiales bacterium]